MTQEINLNRQAVSNLALLSVILKESMLKVKRHSFIRVTVLISAVIILSLPAIAIADELKESDSAREIFKASIKLLLDKNSIPTYQGHRTITVVSNKGVRNQFRINDGYCNKYGGYFAEIERGMKGNQPEPGMGQRPPLHGQGSPPGGGGRGPNPGSEAPHGEMPPMDNRFEKEKPFDPLVSLKRLMHFNRPDMEPTFGNQFIIAEKLMADDSHLSIRGPVSTEIAGRKAWMIEVSPKKYRGGKLRLWVDRETAIPLKKERIDMDGRITYETEYDKIEFVSDDKYLYKEQPERQMQPDMLNPMGAGGKIVPPELMQHEPFVKPPMVQQVEGFNMTEMRKIPIVILPGMHYVFSDGLNTISIFYFDTTRIPDAKKSETFAQKLGERLDSELPYPVLTKSDKNGFVMITSDMEKSDLKRITALIATKNFEELKRYHLERETLLRKMKEKRDQRGDEMRKNPQHGEGHSGGRRDSSGGGNRRRN